jgi:hypothetical protein
MGTQASERRKEKGASQDLHDFIAAVFRRSMLMLDNIIMMVESKISYHAPETKRQSKQLIKKGLSGPQKVKMLTSRTKQMMLMFFYWPTRT